MQFDPGFGVYHLQTVVTQTHSLIRRDKGEALYCAGKSLVVHELVKQSCGIAASSSKCSLAPAVVSINCMTLPTPQAIFGRILAGLTQAAQQLGVFTLSDISLHE